jgi:prolipoprotein diacylglyceryltransferase
MGALVFSKLLAWAESWPQYWLHRGDPAVWLGGKTIVGGLIGGWVGVEITKKILGIRLRTGDAYIIPLCLGIAIGRIGCFLTGLADHTHGIATSLPWAVDFGDGIPRHPTQLYEFVYLLILACVFATKGVGWRHNTAGDGFRWFMLAYMLFRFAIEFIKPTWKGYAGLSAIQWAGLITAGIAAVQLARRRPAPAVAEGV